MFKFLQEANSALDLTTKKDPKQGREKLDQLDQIAGLHPRVAQSAGLGEGFQVCISNDFPGAADAIGPGIMF